MLVGYKISWFYQSKFIGVSGVRTSFDILTVPDICNFVALFNEHFILFLLCGLLIFIAMVGSILLTNPASMVHQKKMQ